MSRWAGFLSMIPGMGTQLRPYLGDFGETHSITLLIDSLSALNVLQKIESGFDNDRYRRLLQMMSSRTDTVATLPDNALPSAAALAVLASTSPALAAVLGVMATTDKLYEADALENLITSLGKLLLGNSFATVVGNYSAAEGYSDIDARDELHDAIGKLLVGLQTSDGMGKLVLLSDLSADEIVLRAKSDIAYRYALENNIPYVIEGAMAAAAYSDRNDDGQLDLERFTDAYLMDRAGFLLWKMNYDAGLEDDNDGWWRSHPATSPTVLAGIPLSLADKAYSDEWDTDLVSEDWIYKALGASSLDADQDGKMDDVELTINGNGGQDHHVKFGDAADNVLGGGASSDRLYGGDGNDTLTGAAGDDRMEGGRGLDTYYVGYGVDVIRDIDGQGEIHWSNGSILNLIIRGQQTAGLGAQDWVQLNAYSFQDRRNGVSYILGFNGDGTTSLTIASGDETQQAVVLIENFKSGDLGIVLPSGHSIGPATPLDNEDNLFGREGQNDADDAVDGGAGNDLLLGGVGNDNLMGNIGDDALYGGPGNDVLHGGDGNDIIVDFSLVSHVDNFDDVDKDSDGKTAYQRFQEEKASQNPEHIFSQAAEWYGFTSSVEAGTQLAGTITGVSLFANFNHADTDKNVVTGGNDVIDAGVGNDFVHSGEGRDSIYGGAGTDSITGGYDDDHIDGGEGDDLIFGDDPWDRASTRVSDQARANGNDVINGGGGNDVVFSGGGNDFVRGGEGNDMLNGGKGQEDGRADADDPDADVIHGDAGNDVISGADGDDKLFGGEGDDSIGGDWDYTATTVQNTRYGNDFLSGGNGNDNLRGGGGNDELRGDDGNDTLRGDDLLLEASKHGDDRLFGGVGSDALHGQSGNDLLDGGKDSDLLYGGEGDDTLIGGAGNDELTGGGGADDFVLSSGWGQDVIWDFSTTDNDTLTFAGVPVADLKYTVGSDGVVIERRGSTDKLTVVGVSLDDVGAMIVDAANSGASTLSAQHNAQNGVAVNASGAQGTAARDEIFGVATADKIFGNGGNDAIYSGAGNDEVDGGEGDDYLQTGMGDDVVAGGVGNDWLIGGGGNDTLDGGAGSDVYVFHPGWGEDTLLGFGSADGASDVIRFEGALTESDLDFSLTSDGTLTISSINGTDKITIPGFVANAGPNAKIIFGTGTTLRLVDIFASAIPLSNGGGTAINGTEGNDAIKGTSLGESIWASAGDDLVLGGGGDDTIYAGEVDDGMGAVISDDMDIVYGQEGNDTIYGMDGKDFLDGGQGNDDLKGGIGSDILIGGDGNDTLFAGEWISINAGLGLSTSVDEGSDDFLSGGSGDDGLGKV